MFEHRVSRRNIGARSRRREDPCTAGCEKPPPASWAEGAQGSTYRLARSGTLSPVTNIIKSVQHSFTERKATGWEGVEAEGYVPGQTTKVVRHTLVGGRKERSTDPGPGLEARYFEVPPGAGTRLAE